MIFDIATQNYYEQSLGNNTFFDIRDDFTAIWKNIYYKEKSINKAEITFFIDDGTGRYERYEDNIIEKIYFEDDILELISSSGLENKGIYSEFTFKEPDFKSERIFFVAENVFDPNKEKLMKSRNEKSEII